MKSISEQKYVLSVLIIIPLVVVMSMTSTVFAQDYEEQDNLDTVESEMVYEDGMLKQEPIEEEEGEVLESSLDYDEATSEQREMEDQELNGDLKNVSVKGKELMRLNQMLKKAIEENQTLKTRNKTLDKQLRNLRGTRALEINRINTITEEIRAIRDQTDSITRENRGYAKEILDLRTSNRQKEQSYGLKIKKLENKLTKLKTVEEPSMDIQDGTAADKPFKVSDLKALLNKYTKQNEKIKMETAGYHYNIGNKYYHRGQYTEAIKQYEKVLEYAPQDSSAHFNLAFVAGEYLRDYDTALKHYQEYLALNPNADDAHLVKEKIINVKLEIRSRIPTRVDSLDEYHFALEQGYNP